MNIILLSGGSGKRLWPLSNDIRSKQFIKLFKDDEGHYESMVQRVYRQIKTVDPEACITIATSKSQVAAINNQLQVDGSDISISIEPKRRDTFPAILLSVAYMVDVLHHDPEEPVVICPVDPYVENSYYETVKRLDKYVREGNAAITLMGIEPTYPSEKYGYIIPKGKDEVSQVSAFKEKPDEATANAYLSQGALWNAGVFAFKLAYLLDKAKTLLPNEGYEDMLARYDSLPKISFDYAVLEKESSIQVVRYRGAWKDVGTWNMIAEVMADKTKGNVIMDETCENTNVVNELDMPVMVMGAKDMIVAVSNDGVLVADKIRSAKMKPLVEKIAGAVHYAEKSWGTYRVIDEDMDEVQGGSLTVRIELKAGSRMTYHSHAFRDETWNILSGKGKALLDGEEYELEPGSSLSIAAGQKHTLRADTDMSIVEVQVGDAIRKQDKRIYELPDE